MFLKYLHKETSIVFRHLSLFFVIFLISFFLLIFYRTSPSLAAETRLPLRAKFNSGSSGLRPPSRLFLPFLAYSRHLTIYNDTEPVHSRIRIVSFGIVADTACNITVKYRPRSTGYSIISPSTAITTGYFRMAADAVLLCSSFLSTQGN